MENLDYTNFKSWYVDVLTKLYFERDAGFAILMISFPLLERYLRSKANNAGDSLTDKSMSELINIFPELTDLDTARDFWKVYRHGLLHKVSFSEGYRISPKSTGGLSHEKPIVSIEANNEFWIHPVKFSQKIIEVICSDFLTFVGSIPVVTPPPKIKQYANSKVSGLEPSVYLGTRTSE